MPMSHHTLASKLATEASPRYEPARMGRMQQKRTIHVCLGFTGLTAVRARVGSHGTTNVTEPDNEEREPG